MDQDDARPDAPASRLLTYVLAATLVLVGLLAVPASAQNTTQLTINAREDCPDTTFCFEVIGNLEGVEPGDILDITLTNSEDNLQEHNVHVADLADANPGEDETTPGNRAFANSEDVSPGNDTSFSAEVPDNAEAIYLWCTIRAHEQQGMFVEVELAGVEEGEENGSPGFTAIAGVAALVGLAALTRER